MTLLDIKFNFKGIDYTGKIHRVGNGPILYTTHDIKPELPIPMLTFSCELPDKLRFEINAGYEGIEKVLAESILTAVHESGLQLCE